MKKILIIGLLSFISLITFAQDKNVEVAINKWIDCFNEKNYRGAYDLYASVYKQKVPLETVTAQMKEVFGMMGKLKSIKFISYKDYVYKYIFYAKTNLIEADVSIVINKDYQFGYLGFESIGGTGDPPKAGKGEF
ncbi:hypothetical protein [Pedobacter boryungensis]|uniref:DUF3887 domain-containing protein n=1 Tax=Pedobacter boryungensis TaxID=869962 RepID=A0ABX2D9X0_9SPHI|nr:hypothetical protein [Pedobacter boryungensis]NQX30111.1 hypothetical protein [Pedobacter boryungensis]